MREDVEGMREDVKGDIASPDASEPLAVIVEKPRTQDTIDALQAEGIYDSTRRVEPYGDERVAVPVVRPPTETPVEETRPLQLPRRERGLSDLLFDRGFSESEIAAAPSSWAVIGSVLLVDFGDVSASGALSTDRRREVGEALLQLHGNADTVLARGGVSGTRREPSGEVLAGNGETETIHTEHGTKYALDLSTVMFSPGNKAERVRMGDLVAPDERVFDMFAGIGYFTLPMARNGAAVTAAELNPESYRFLVENAMLNEVSDRVRAVLGDCRDVETSADRIVMGYYDAHEYLDAALDALVSGGTLHLHEATPGELFPERPIERLEAAATGGGRSAEILDTRVVKSHSEGVVHGVVDARLG